MHCRTPSTPIAFFGASPAFLRRLLAFAFLLLTLAPSQAAPKTGGIEVCVVEKVDTVRKGQSTLTFLILRDDDRWSENTYQATLPRFDHFVGRFFLAERTARGWTLSQVFSESESKDLAAKLREGGPGKGRSPSLRQRLLDDFLTSVRL